MSRPADLTTQPVASKPSAAPSQGSESKGILTALAAAFSQAEADRQGSARARAAGLGSKREFVDAPAAQAKSTRNEVRRLAYANQREAARLMWANDTTGRPGGVTFCGWTQIASKAIDIFRDESGDDLRAYYSGLQKCGQAWTCACCARPKAEKGREFLNALLSLGRSEGWHVVMMTLTARHRIDMPLGDLWAAMSGASDRLRKSRTWKALKPAMVGSVRAVEATHGVHGWHPHFHVLIAFRSDAADDEAGAIALTERLRAEWMHQLDVAGLSGNEHAFHVQGGGGVGNYIAKWGMAEELTLTGAKTGRDGGRTPWQLLNASREGDAAAGKLWYEFSRVIKGTHQLRATPYLKELVGIEIERRAEEDAEGEHELKPEVVVGVHVATVDRHTWIEGGGRYRRLRALEAAEKGTVEQARAAVDGALTGEAMDRDLLAPDDPGSLVEAIQAQGIPPPPAAEGSVICGQQKAYRVRSGLPTQPAAQLFHDPFQKVVGKARKQAHQKIE